MSILRAHHAENNDEGPVIAPSLGISEGTPSTSNTFPETDDLSPSDHGRQPDLLLNTKDSYVDILRPDKSLDSQNLESSTTPSRIELDVSSHVFTDDETKQRLEQFRQSFLPTFPFVRIPDNENPEEFRRQKPFTWIVIMALTERIVAKQFELEETIWEIITKRVVGQHYANIDLLLGIMAFSAW